MMNNEIIYQPQFSAGDVNIVEQKLLYKGFVQVEAISLRHRQFSNAQFGRVLTREIVRRQEAAGVFVYDPTLKKFLLIEQFRAGALNLDDTPWQLEIIAGLIDEGEDALTCLTREAIEEAGCHINNPHFLYRYHPSTGASDEIFNFYAATADLSECGGIHGEASENEDIKVHIFDYADIPQLLKQGLIRNAPLLIAIQWFQLFLSQQAEKEC